MFINGVNILSLFPNNLQFLDYQLPNPSWDRGVTVMDSDYKIVDANGNVAITSIPVRFGIFDTKENSYVMASKIISLLDDALVQFINGGLTYRVQVGTSGKLSYKFDGLSEFQLTLQVLETMGVQSSVNGAIGAMSLVNEGSVKSPVVFTITPAANIASISIQGFLGNETTPLTINLLHTNRRIIVDGEKGLIQEETATGSNLYVNKFLDTNLSYFPYIKVGTTAITYTPYVNIAINAKFNPRYI